MELKIIEKSVDELIPYVNNARTHSEEQVYQIAASIKEFGFNNPILLDGENGVIAGHGRLMAAKKLKLEKVPCIELSHLSESQKRAFILADNKLALNADWDNELLNIELEALKDDDIDLSLIGFSDDELEEISKEFDEEQKLFTDEEADEIPEEVETKCKLGDIWQLGEHRLMCGDSTDENCVKKLMGEELAVLVTTDPPYNVAIGSKNAFLNKFQKAGRIIEDIKNDKGMTDEECGEKLWKPAFANLRKFSDDSASIYVTMPQGGAHMMMMMMMMAAASWQVKHELIWCKNSPTFSMNRLNYDYKHEPILFGWAKSHKFYGGGTCKNSVWEFDKPRKCDLHPTMKPVALFVEMILNSSQKDEVVLDLFGGSGTTLIACEQTQRKARLMELDERYVSVIVNRWLNFTGRKDEILCIRDGKKLTYDEVFN